VLGVADGVRLDLGVGVVELVGLAGVVVAVAGVKVAAEAACDLVERPVADGGRRRQARQGMAGGEADVGLGVAGPPGQHPRSVTGGVLDAMRDEGAEGAFARLAAAGGLSKGAGRPGPSSGR
jgi:hypothetical protein